MAGRGLVTREECSSDGRGAFVVLSPAGRTAIERAAPGHARKVRDVVFDHLTAEELAALEAVTAKVLARLEPDAAPSCSVVGGPTRAGGGTPVLGRRRTGDDGGRRRRRRRGRPTQVRGAPRGRVGTGTMTIQSPGRRVPGLGRSHRAGAGVPVGPARRPAGT